jgi:deoxyribodipyrimidine photo-lyase
LLRSGSPAPRCHVTAPALVWFRRDLRLDDHPALRAAVASGRPVACAFVLDERIVRGPGSAPIRVGFLLEGLRDLDARLRDRGGGLLLRSGQSERELVALVRELGAAEVHACADDGPFARSRDARAARLLGEAGVALVLHDDLTVQPHAAVEREAGGAYRAHSAYARAVERLGIPEPIGESLRGHLRPADAPIALPQVESLAGGTQARSGLEGGETAALARLRIWRDGGLARYATRRDQISDPGATSRLSAYLKLGMLSPRRCAAVAASAGARKWLSELLWRDWFKYVLHHHPDLAERSVDSRYDALEWSGDDAAFARWTRGETGFGLVDAGMRQLAETGYQPNRVRMVCASFLVKHLHVDWRRGERWYRERLVDGDLSQNAGNWQWVAGTGLDAAPWFRIFNPDLQERRFDPDGTYVARWAPDRPVPMIELAREREVTLVRYRAVLEGGPPPEG